MDDPLPQRCLLCGATAGIRRDGQWHCAVCDWRVGDAPDPDLPPPRVDVVYYLRFDDRIKIGTTANPRRRFAAIWHDEVLAFERGDRMIERRRHEQFAVERFARTEWFAASIALLAHIDVVAGGVDPWDRHARWISEAVASRG